MSRAADIAAELVARMTAITVANGYATDLGAQVFRGKRVLSEEDIPCAILVEGDDTAKEQAETDVNLTQAYLIEGHADCDPDNPNDAAHLIIADLKRAVFSGDLRLGGLASGIRYKGRVIDPRESGTSLIAAAIEIEVDYAEDLANP